MHVKSIFFLILVLLGAGLFSAPARANEDVVKVLRLYVKALEWGTASQGHPFYTPGTANMMQRRKVSKTIMKLEAQTIRSCESMLPIVKEQRAVIVFPYGNPDTCNPYFFVNNKPQEKKGQESKDLWQLDLETMMHVIKYDSNNHWRIDDTVENPYKFAFEPEQLK